LRETLFRVTPPLGRFTIDVSVRLLPPSWSILRMARYRRSGVLVLSLCGLALSAAPATAQAPSPTDAEFFEKHIRPLLVERCLECHGGSKKIRGGLRLTARADLMRGGDSGPAAVAGKPDASLLIQAVRYRDELRMPPKAKLTDHEIAALTRWVKMGLPWPDAKATVGATKDKFHITDEQRRFWAFQPVKAVRAPVCKDTRWPRSDLDRFILAGLETKGLRPAPQTDKRTLIRRATFDLTGLPPTPEEIDAFLKDKAPEAFAKVVDRLLSSPHYGERWGRHWLDVVRYADSFDARLLGGDNPLDMVAAWRYRDWVVNAFNRDMPYDRFIMNQIAGDLLPAPTAGALNKDGIIATGVLAIGNWGGGDADKEKMHTDIIDDQLDVVSRAFMGLTVTCARCHDHKFDPISQEDYYGLAGIFFSSHILPTVGLRTNGPDMLRIPLDSAADLARRAEHKKRIAALETRLKFVRAEQARDVAHLLLPQTADYVLAAWDHRNPPAGQPRLTLEKFAASRKLHAYALRRWGDYLGLGEYPLLKRTVRDLGGKPGVHGWLAQPEPPSLVVNTTAKPVQILTFRLPPHSVAVHPGPDRGVAVSWKSPIRGTVRVRGGVSDADPVAGDGIAWVLDQRTPGGARQLASGYIPNGGSQRFSQGEGADALTAVKVNVGDRIDLLVLPRENYSCDTTVVELIISAADGSTFWDLERDLRDDPLRSNPHPDRQGHADVWHFCDMGESRRGPQPASAGQAAWERAVAGVLAGRLPRTALETAAREFARTFTLADVRSPFWPPAGQEASALPPAARAAAAKLSAELDALRKNPPAPPAFAHGAQEGGIPKTMYAGFHDVRVHARGSYLRLGNVVPRRFPHILAGAKQPPITKGSGRLELAKWLSSPEHPLTARVMVNRLWQHHFGEGIVRTPSNFGKLGERPTHPELLDWLARQFVESGWSIKHMHRLIMLSATYQQGCEPAVNPQSAIRNPQSVDPDNRLWGRMNRRRLEAEEIRDNLLAVAGRLDRTAGGPATRDFGSPRRSLYQMTVRSDRAGFGPLFDTPDSTQPVEKRIASTVAPQALFLLNHPFVLQQTQALAKRLVASAKDDRTRIRQAYELLYGRSPLAAEERIGLDFLARAGSGQGGWEEYCQVLLCANEFIYVD
jgi:hypothetical protein